MSSGHDIVLNLNIKPGTTGVMTIDGKVLRVGKATVSMVGGTIPLVTFTIMPEKLAAFYDKELVDWLKPEVENHITETGAVDLVELVRLKNDRIEKLTKRVRELEVLSNRSHVEQLDKEIAERPGHAL